MSQLTRQQITTCANVLARLEPGFFPEEIFGQVARLVRLPMVDVIPIRREGRRFFYRAGQEGG